MTKSAQGDEIDTAILLADSFDHRFTPITLDIPRVRILSESLQIGKTDILIGFHRYYAL